MSQHVSRTALILALGVASLVSGLAELAAQENRRVQISGGLAISYARDGRQGEGYGGALSMEYVAHWTKWVSGRLYGGVFLSLPGRGSCPPGVEPCVVSAQVGLAGAKGRILIPFPHVGPFIELGAGLSAGSLETRIGGRGFRSRLDENDSGIFVHIPGSLGLAFGTHHQHEFSLDYFFHRAREHAAATLALGIGLSWE